MIDTKKHRTFLILAVVLGCGCVAVRAQEDGPGRPNILFAIADDWSHGHAGAYGCGWIKTPAFDEIAKKGLLFTRAYTPNAKCAPSRACILTGRNSWQLKDAGNHMCYFPAEFRTYVETLNDHGYFVGYTGKGWGPGIAKDAEGRPRTMTGRPFASRRSKPPAGRISANDYAGNFADFLRQAPQDGPWCFWYGTTEPHRGYEYGAGVAKGGKKLTDVDHVPAFWPDNETIRNDMLDYAFEVEHFDRHLGRILRLLEREGQLDNTLIVATSDHGMPFPRCKGQAYEYSNHVPLSIMWPKGIKHAGRTVSDYISFIDLAPTFLQVAEVTPAESGMRPITGQSLLDIFQSNKSGRVSPERDHVLIGKERHDIGRPDDAGYPIRGIIKDQVLYIRNYETDRWPAGNPETGYLNCDGGATKTNILVQRRNGDTRHWKLCFGKRPAEEMYLLDQDPDCVNNVAGKESHQQLKRELASQMSKAMRAEGDPRFHGEPDYFDRLPYTSAGTRNFYQRYTGGERLRAGWVNPDDFEKAKLD